MFQCWVGFPLGKLLMSSLIWYLDYEIVPRIRVPSRMAAVFTFSEVRVLSCGIRTEPNHLLFPGLRYFCGAHFPA